jgi:hypothetical protein
VAIILVECGGCDRTRQLQGSSTMQPADTCRRFLMAGLATFSVLCMSWKRLGKDRDDRSRRLPWVQCFSVTEMFQIFAFILGGAYLLYIAPATEGCLDHLLSTWIAKTLAIGESCFGSCTILTFGTKTILLRRYSDENTNVDLGPSPITKASEQTYYTVRYLWIQTGRGRLSKFGAVADDLDANHDRPERSEFIERQSPFWRNVTGTNRLVMQTSMRACLRPWSARIMRRIAACNVICAI